MVILYSYGLYVFPVEARYRVCHRPSYGGFCAHILGVFFTLGCAYIYTCKHGWETCDTGPSPTPASGGIMDQVGYLPY